LYYLKSKINSLLKHDIIPLAVFDSERPKIKAETIGHKRSSKCKANTTLTSPSDTRRYVNKLIGTVPINKARLDAIVQLLEKMNVQFVFAPKEADSQLAYLLKQNVVDAVITEDSDQLVYVN
jgi:exonuclease 1